MSRAVNAASLALALALWGGSARAAGDCAAARDGFRGLLTRSNPWSAVAVIESCASDRGLPADLRARSLREAGFLRSLMGDDVGARRALEELLALTPGDSHALLRLAELLRDQPEEALGWAERAAEASPTLHAKAAAL